MKKKKTKNKKHWKVFLSNDGDGGRRRKRKKKKGIRRRGRKEVVDSRGAEETEGVGVEEKKKISSKI